MEEDDCGGDEDEGSTEGEAARVRTFSLGLDLNLDLRVAGLELRRSTRGDASKGVRSATAPASLRGQEAVADTPGALRVKIGRRSAHEGAGCGRRGDSGIRDDFNVLDEIHESDADVIEKFRSGEDDADATELEDPPAAAHAGHAEVRMQGEPPLARGRGVF